MNTPRMTEQEWSEHQRRVRISKSKKGRAGAILPCAPQKACEGITTHRSTSPYRSKWDAAYASKLEMEKRAGVILNYWYEPFSMWLPGQVRYKPDFLVQKADPRFVVTVDMTLPTVLEVIEVKGWSRNLRDGMTRLKIAAALFPCFTWTLARKTKDGWEEQQP